MKLRSSAILIAHMDDKGFSVGRLATYAECSRSMIGHLRSGYKRSCTPALATRIAEALHVPRSVLFVEQPSADRGHTTTGKRTVAA